MLESRVKVVQENIAFRVISKYWAYIMIPKYLLIYADTGFSPRLPIGVTETSITSSSVTIHWLLTDPYDPSRPEAFVITYGVISGQLNMRSAEITATPSSQIHSTQLHSLRPATTYYYQIEIRNRFETVSTNQIHFETEDGSKLIIKIMWF